MPREYKEIKKLVDKLAYKNDLGNKNFSFSIINGDYMSWNMKDLDLCEGDICWYYKNLNPYKKYKKFNDININELSNQAYLYGGVEGYAWRDMVMLSKSTFRSLRENNGFLGCIIGHELSHILYSDHIKNQLTLSSKIKELGILKNDKSKNNDIEDKEKNLLEMEISREDEIAADQGAAKLLINAGFPKNTCTKWLTYMTELEKLETETDPKSTHPGYLERYSELEKFTKKYQKNDDSIVFKPREWKWSYKRDNNILTFIPISK